MILFLVGLLVLCWSFQDDIFGFDIPVYICTLKCSSSYRISNRVNDFNFGVVVKVFTPAEAGILTCIIRPCSLHFRSKVRSLTCSVTLPSSSTILTSLRRAENFNVPKVFLFQLRFLRLISYLFTCPFLYLDDIVRIHNIICESTSTNLIALCCDTWVY